MFGLGTTELLIVLVVILLLFGGTQLPKLARSLGQAQREFNKGTNTPAEPEETT
jgi:sec-independent protein translocase protein TatA